MSPKEELPKELKAMEAALCSLVPRTDGVNRDRLMFLAGRESVIQGGTGRRIFRHRLAWPLTTSVMTTAAAVLLVMRLARREPQPEPAEPGPWSRLLARVTQVDWPPRHRPSRYSERFERMLAAGPNARLNYATGPVSEDEPSAAPVSCHELLDSLLGTPESETPPLDSFPMNSSPLTPGANS